MRSILLFVIAASAWINEDPCCCCDEEGYGCCLEMEREEIHKGEHGTND